MLAIAALVALSVWAMFRWPALGFVAGSFFLLLAPTSSVAPLEDLAFDPRMYLPRAAVVVRVVLSGCAARRFRAVLGEQKYLAIYHLRSPAVVESNEWREAVETPWTRSIRPHMTDRMRVVFSSYVRTGRGDKK